jgi:hypothetical protein
MTEDPPIALGYPRFPGRLDFQNEILGVHLSELIFLFCGSCILFDETQANFIKRKHPRKRERKKQGAWTKVQAKKQP